MFNLGLGDAPNAPGASEAAVKFNIKNFLDCYKHFFRSSLIYEAGSLTFRTLMYDNFVRGQNASFEQSDWYKSFALGSFTQGILFNRQFNSHILNHTGSILEKNKKEFKSLKSQIGSKFIETSPLIYLRGGVIGAFTLTLNERIV